MATPPQTPPPAPPQSQERWRAEGRAGRVRAARRDCDRSAHGHDLRGDRAHPQGCLARARRSRSCSRRAARQGATAQASAGCQPSHGSTGRSSPRLSNLSHRRRALLIAFIPSPRIGPLTLHVRADAGRDPRVRLADGEALGRDGRRLGSRDAGRGLGGRLRGGRGAPVPRPHVVERGAHAEVEGHLRGLAGRPRRVGRDPLRHDRWCRRRPPFRLQRAKFMDAVAPGPRRRDRADRELAESGARQADDAPVGPRSTRRTVRSSTSTRRRSTRRSSTS